MSVLHWLKAFSKFGGFSPQNFADFLWNVCCNFLGRQRCKHDFRFTRNLGKLQKFCFFGRHQEFYDYTNYKEIKYLTIIDIASDKMTISIINISALKKVVMNSVLEIKPILSINFFDFSFRLWRIYVTLLIKQLFNIYIGKSGQNI